MASTIDRVMDPEEQFDHLLPLSNLTDGQLLIWVG